MAVASGREKEAELAQGLLVRAPVAPHEHPQVQVDLDAEKALQLLPGEAPDALEHGPARADHDRLLRVVLDEDAGPRVETRGAGALGQLLDADRAGVGDLLMGEPEDLLPDRLGDEEGLRLV